MLDWKQKVDFFFFKAFQLLSNHLDFVYTQFYSLLW